MTRLDKQRPIAMQKLIKQADRDRVSLEWCLRDLGLKTRAERQLFIDNVVERQIVNGQSAE